jgi:hypothetical protein
MRSLPARPPVPVQRSAGPALGGTQEKLQQLQR